MTDETNGQKERWHFRKELSIGNVLTAVFLAGGLFVWGSDVETRIERNAVALKTLSDRIERTDSRNQHALDRIHETLVRIEEKLDGKVDRRWRGRE